MKILHVSAECYPAAKAGGMGDVVGALPKYLKQLDQQPAVIIPKYFNRWISNHTFELTFAGAFKVHNQYVPFTIERLADADLGFPFYTLHLPGKFDRPGIYADPEAGWYNDEADRFLYFQLGVLEWIMHQEEQPDLIHCHDHHTGLLPFLIKNGEPYRQIRHIPTVFTIHNGEYHGAFGWDKLYLFPPFEPHLRGLIDWNGQINPLAAGIKNAWTVTTVSPTYLEELGQYSNGMEWLIRNERSKAKGILNGIDQQVWDPKTDQHLHRILKQDVSAFKWENKKALTERFQIDLGLPIVTFIGRLVREKGADLLPDLIKKVLDSGLAVGFLILGTGEPYLHQVLGTLKGRYPQRFDLALEYNEGLAHQLYAGSDFLLMPSRVEPCGLNQMYAMRYGTIPIVRTVGGLKDTVIDLQESPKKALGIRFDAFSLEDGFEAIWRAVELFNNGKLMDTVRERIHKVDFSWEKSAQSYLDIYRSFKTKKTKVNGK